MAKALPDGLLLTFYGDDFTGSTDVMEALARTGLRTALFLTPPTPETLERWEGLRAVGVAGVARSLSPSEMEAELPPLLTELRRLQAPLTHYKICSTFDSAPHVGSIGKAMEIGQRVFPCPSVPIVVGAPALNRFCVFGNLFARSGPESDIFRLDRHPTMRQHPVTPMDESDLRLHLARQTTASVGLVDVLSLDRGIEHVEAQWKAEQEAGRAGLLFDTQTGAHLAIIGELLWKHATLNPSLFIVGSSGVEYALTAHWRAAGLLPEAPVFTAPPVEQIVVVSGSCSPVTARQIAWARANGFAVLPLPSEAWMEEDSTRGILGRLMHDGATALERGQNVVIHACEGPEDVRLTHHAGTWGSVPDSSRRLGTTLGLLLRDLLLRSGVRRAAVTGGDTSGYVARTLGIEALEMAAPMAPGSPLCRASLPGSPLDGLEILFKGGQVGREDLFGSIKGGGYSGVQVFGYSGPVTVTSDGRPKRQTT